MTLPQEMEEDFLHKLYEYQEEKKMPFLAPFEQLAIEKGLKQGLKRGIEIGREEGSVKETQAMIMETLNERLGQLPTTLTEAIQRNIDLTQLRILRKQAIRVDSLDEMAQIMDELKNQKEPKEVQ